MSDAPDRGITVTEIVAMGQPVDVTPETTVAFVGRTLRGPLNTPILVTNFGEFRRRFGDVWSRSSLGPAVRDFFEHGGTRLYVVRVANGARGSMICLPARGSALVLRAIEPGSTEALRVAVDYDGIQSEDGFNLTLQRIDQETNHVIDQEYYRNVSFLEGSQRFVLEALLSSGMARVELPLPTHRPEATVGLDRGIGVNYVEPAESGTDGNALTDYDLIGSKVDNTGLFALDKVEQVDVIYLPPVARGRDTGPTALLAAELYCRQRGAMLVTDPSADWTDAETAVHAVRDLGYASPNMLSYFPRVTDARESDRQGRVAGGAIAGLLCKLDSKFGPWQLLDQQGLGLARHLKSDIELDDEDITLLERSGLNVLLSDSVNRLRVSGNKTLARGTEAHRRMTSLSVRRLCLRIVHVTDVATRWAVFEQPGPRLAGRVQGQVHAGFLALYDLGAFADDQFNVQCRVETSEGPHAVHILLTFTPAGSESPVSLTLHQSVSGCQVTHTAFGPALKRTAEPVAVTPVYA